MTSTSADKEGELGEACELDTPTKPTQTPDNADLAG
jgi:hypothetical protein